MTRVVVGSGAAIYWAAFAAFAVNLGTSIVAHAKTVNVDGTCSLPAAVNVVNNGAAGLGCAFTDTADPAYVIVMPPASSPGGTVTLARPLEFRRSVTVRGGAGRSLILAEIGAFDSLLRVLDPINAGEVSVALENLSIERLSGNPEITGIYVFGAALSVQNSYIAGFGLSGIVSIDSNVSISFSTIERNSSSDSGAGIQFNNPSYEIRPAHLDVESSWILSNASASAGGGVYTSEGTSSIRYSNIINNEAVDGGGFYTSDGDAVISNTNIVGNRAVTGGGLYGGGGSEQRGALLVSGCRIYDNSADAAGGGVYVGPGLLTSTASRIEQCRIAGNRATDGGGIAIDGGPSADSATNVQLEESLIDRNSAYDSGGGIWNTGQLGPGADNNTIFRNTATTGGGIFVDTSGEFDLRHSTIAFNAATGATGIGGVEVRRSGTTGFTFNLIASNSARHDPDDADDDEPSDAAWWGSPWTVLNLIGSGTDDLCESFPTDSSRGNMVGGCDFEATDDDGQPIVGRYSNPIDPRFAASLQALTWPIEVLALCPDSPAVDKITAGDFTSDQRGAGRRIPGENQDIGAFELGPADRASIMCTDPVAQYGSAELIDLGVLHPGAHLIATGINSFGDVSGAEMTPTSSVAWRFDAATEAWSKIEPSPADAAAYNGWYPTGIDDAGVVVGSSSWHGEGFLALRGAPAHIVTGRHGYADVSDVNAQGQLAGSEPFYVGNAYAGYIAAFRRDQDGSMYYAGVPSGATLGGGTLVGHTYALGIAPQAPSSEHGVDIVGYAALHEGERTFASGMVFRPGWGMREAYRFTGTYVGASGMQNLNDDAAANGWQLLYMAYATNGSDIVGWGVHDDRCRAFRYRIASKHVTDLGSLEQTHPGADLCDYGQPGHLFYYYPTAINAAGAIVGSVAYGGAFYYSDSTGMMDLQLLVDGSLGVTLDSALDMNDSGEVVGSMHVPNDARAHAYKLILPAAWL
jgi:hypothetical protein